jgi:hypothetical protein
MKNRLLLVAALLSVGCLAPVEEPAPAPVEEEQAPAAALVQAPTCPQVECAWTAEGQCNSAFSYENTREDLEDGSVCFVFIAACVTVEVNPECIPENCKQNQFATCTTQP